MTAWTQEKTAALRTMVIRGCSDSEIGRALGVTRNAAGNKITREGFTPLRPRLCRPVRHVPLLPVIVTAPIDPGAVRLLDARIDQCRWIVGEATGADTLVCGEPVKRNSWCAHHSSIGHLS